jgi:putative protease
LLALRAAVDNGADAIYTGLRGGTNARNFPGLNFDRRELVKGVGYAHQRGARVLLAINVYPQPDGWKEAVQALEAADEIGVDAVILADLGLLRYASLNLPRLRLHLSVQASATNRHAIGFYQEHFGVRRVVLPRVLSLAQVKRLVNAVSVEVEVFGFGSLCVMVEGRCALSSYLTGESPNTRGVCSPAWAVRWQETSAGRTSRLNGALIDCVPAGQPAGYPTLCKGRYRVDGKVFHAIEEPTSLNVLEMLPDLVTAGIAGIKVEGRQRSPTYVAQVTRTLRAALDACAAEPDWYEPRAEWSAQLDRLSEGRSHTLGALHRLWQ